MKSADADAGGAHGRDLATEALRASYRAVRYESRPCAASTPERMATIAALMGLAAPDPATARVLEIACGDGGNLLPMAARSPNARFVGIDLASEAVADGRKMADALGLDNATLLDGDLRDMPADLGPFDYIIAHGFYSWVPAEVRVVLFETIRRRLAPDGIAFVSHNVMPGTALRGITWSALRPHVESIADPAAKVAETQAMAARIAAAMERLPGLAAGMAQEFRDVAGRFPFLVMHDDLAPVNHAVYLREIAAEAASHGLAWLADADPYRHPAPAFGDEMNAWLASVDRLTREHMIDHLRLRRFRESLFIHGGRDTGGPLDAGRLAGMHVAAANSTVERHDASRPADTPGDRSPAAVQRRLLARLVARHPSSAPVREIAEGIASESLPGSHLAQPAEAVKFLLSGCLMGILVPLARPATLVREAGERPFAFGPARLQAQRLGFVANLRHDAVAFNDPVQRRLLPLMDGTRTRAELAAALAGFAAEMQGVAPLDAYLAHFARAGILEA